MASQKEARTRGFASLSFLRYAFFLVIWPLIRGKADRVNSGIYVERIKKPRRSGVSGNDGLRRSFGCASVLVPLAIDANHILADDFRPTNALTKIAG